jgi:hypothetical protein
MSHEPGHVEEHEDGTILVGKNKKQEHREKCCTLEEEVNLDDMPQWAQLLYHQNKEILETLRQEER